MVYKSESLTLRLTPREVEIIDQYREGASRSAFIRSIIQSIADSNAVPYPGEPRMTDQVLPPVPTVEAAPVVESPLTEQPVQVETVSTNDLEEGAVKKHFHKRGAVITTRYDKGQTITTYECAEPGCYQTMEG